MSVLGTRVVRREDPALLTGASRYVEDVAPRDALFVAFARSPEAHARIESIDVSAAQTAPGVVAVHTSETLGVPDRAPMLPEIDSAFSRPVLAREVVRFVGEPVAVVVAATRQEAVDAVELIEVTYVPLPVVTDVDESLGGEVLLFPHVGSNVMLTGRAGCEPDGVFDGADVVVTRRMVNHRMAPVPLEGRSVAAHWDSGRMTVWISTQSAFDVRNGVAALLGLEPGDVRVVFHDVGGGFGSKGSPQVEELAVIWLSRLLGRPTRWTETRSENLLAMPHARAQVQTVSVGATADGRIVGIHLRVVQDAGAYPAVGALLPRFTGLMAAGVYDVERVSYQYEVVGTNTNPVGAFRGAGRPEACYAIERVVDELADELGLDPAELRRRNFLRPEQFPLTTAVGAAYDNGKYARALTLALDAADYDGLRADQRRRSASGSSTLLGVGLASYVEVTNPGPRPDDVAIRITGDGRAEVRTGSAAQGQGHQTSWAMVASDVLGIPLERIDTVHGDTDAVPQGAVVGGSRTAQSLGSAVLTTAEEIVEAAKEQAARVLEAAVEDVVFDAARGEFHVAGTPALGCDWARVAGSAGGEIALVTSTPGNRATFPFGTHVAVVEVDVETGAVRVVRYVAVDDCGRILNPMIVEGQVHGGISSGIGHALMEEVVYDDSGNPLTSTLADYAMISAAELPSFETVPMETPTPVNRLGAKGIGESGSVGAPPAVVNAVVDALSHLGVRHIDTPLSPQRVWSAIRAATT